MKKEMIAFALCASMALSLAACGNPAADSSSPDGSAAPSNSSAQIPNPWTACPTMEDAVSLAGFDFVLPANVPDGFSNPVIQAEENAMIQVVYQGGDRELCFRKAVGADDPSGDYLTYETTDSISVDSLDVTVKGNGDKVNLAFWSQDGYAYSIGVYAAETSDAGVSADGLDQETVMELIRATDSTEEPTIGGDPNTWGPALDAEAAVPADTGSAAKTAAVISGEKAADADSAQPVLISTLNHDTEAAVSDETGTVSIPNPWVDCDSLEDAVSLAGFDMAVPDAVDGFSNRSVRAMGQEIIEVIDRNDETDEQEIRIRKGVGSEDISGDYNQYRETSTESAGDCAVTLKGADGNVVLAIWNSGSYTYSIGVYGGSGISHDAMTALVAAVQ